MGESGRSMIADALLKWVTAIDTVYADVTLIDKPPVPNRALLPTLFFAASKLLDGDRWSRSTLPRATYSFLAIAVKRGATSSVPTTDVLQLAKKGMMHRDRSSRVAARRVMHSGCPSL